MASDTPSGTSTTPEPYVYAGAGTGGLYRKAPEEDRWEELTNGLPPSPEVRALAIHPLQPGVVFAGTQDGLYRSGSHGDHWRRIDIPVASSVVWSLLLLPHNPRLMYVGMAPAQIFRTRDGGRTWDSLPIPLGDNIVSMSFDTRVIAMAVNPREPDEIYAALEVGGMIRSLDGGESWEPINAGLSEGGEDRLDLHGVQVSAEQPDTPYISTRQGMFRGRERGNRWEPIDLGKYSPITYTRDLLLSPQHPNTLYVSVGGAARSEVGALFRSRDLGETWERVDHDVTPRSTMMAVAINSRVPSQVYCASRGGQIFASLDDGATWTEYHLPEGVEEVYALAVG
jgi:photosystem II stability/assembly factor-like uncharacterized protein